MNRDEIGVCLKSWGWIDPVEFKADSGDDTVQYEWQRDQWCAYVIRPWIFEPGDMQFGVYDESHDYSGPLPASEAELALVLRAVGAGPERRVGLGAKGVRDPAYPCPDYDPGDTEVTASCETDCHYLCRGCRWNGSRATDREVRRG